ncbi:MAG: peptide chain release factor N(5)-glutamine methyltransferase [Woeseiaceae bacterium]
MTEPLSIKTVLDDATRRIATASDSARLDAELLLAKAIDMPRSYLFAHPEDEPDDAALERFETNLARRIAGEPMAYICGEKEFWSMPLMVTPATLVPRPETEILVDLALREIPRRGACRVLDLGTGSGAIALAIAKERPLCDVTAVDISADALQVAIQNARQLQLGNVRFLQGSWTEPVAGECFDIIVSNPPYVREDDEALQRLGAEPRAALVAGEDGLDAIREILGEAGDIVVPNGLLFLEHGFGQAADVEAICLRSAWIDIRCHNDYAGLPRVTVARSKTCKEIT